MDQKKAMFVQVHVDMRLNRGSVDRIVHTLLCVNQAFSMSVAALGETNEADLLYGKPCYIFTESYWKNRVLNKILGLNVFTFDRLIDIIEKEKPDILHFHNRLDIVDLCMERLSYKPKVVVQYHRHIDKYRIPRSADLLLAVSHNLKEDIAGQNHQGKWLDVLYNPVPITLIQGLPHFKRRTHGARPVMLYAGGLRRNKGFYQLMDAVKKMDHVTFTLILVGGLLEHWKSDRPHVINKGVQQVHEYYPLLHDSDIFLAPSKREGFGLAALEALYCGKLVVAARAPGLDEIFDDSCAFLYDWNDPSGLADAMSRAMATFHDSQLMSAYAESAQRVVSHYLPERIASVLSAYYRGLF